MKCVSNPDAPCERCRKGKRQCLYQTKKHEAVVLNGAGLQLHNPNNTAESPQKQNSSSFRSLDFLATASLDLPRKRPYFQTVLPEPTLDPSNAVNLTVPNSSSPENRTRPFLPSIYSTSPLEAVTESSRDADAPSFESTTSLPQTVSSKRKRIDVPVDSRTLSLDQIEPASSSEEDAPIERQNMIDLIYM
jgi:hypothetical protein